MTTTPADRAAGTPANAPKVLGLTLEGRKATAFFLLRHPSGLWRFLTDKEAPKLPRVMALFAVAYFVLPIDLVPDLVPIFGWLDDVGLTAAAVGYIASQAAAYANGTIAKQEDARIEVKEATKT